MLPAPQLSAAPQRRHLLRLRRDCTAAQHRHPPCIARGAGVEFDKAASIAGETIAQLIKGQHDGQIKQVGTKALTIEELRRGSVNSAVIGAVELCPKEVPPDLVKKVNDALKQQGGK